MALLFIAAAACESSHNRATIELTPRVVLAGVGDSVDLMMAPSPAVATNRYYAAARSDPPANGVAIYDSSGRYVHTVGKAGGGPGEFQSLDGFGFGPGDTLWVIDGMFIAEVFAPPPSRAHVRTVRFERPIAGWVTDHGFLAGAYVSSSRHSPTRLVSWDGVDRARFIVPGTTDGPELQVGPVTLAAPDRLWVGLESKYEIDLVDTNQVVRQRVTRQVDWFPEGPRMTGMPWVTPPPPRVHAVSLGPDGLLWVLVRRAHRNWAENTRKAGSTPSGPVSPRRLGVRINDLFEGVLDVFDPASGTLLASRDVSGGVIGFARPGVLTEILEQETGAISIQLWDVLLKR